MDEKRLWRFRRHFGRMGSLEGVFVASVTEVDKVVGRKVYYGEILGKHSDVSFTAEDKDFERLDGVSAAAVEEVSKVLGTTWSGHNPLDRLREQADEGYGEEE